MRRFTRILLVLDPLEPCVSLVERAVAFAKNSQADLTLAAVVPRFVLAAGLPPDGPITTELQERLEAEQRQRLEALAEPWRDGRAIRTRVLTGTPFLEVVREVLRGGATRHPSISAHGAGPVVIRGCAGRPPASRPPRA